MARYVLGINFGSHDAAIALYSENKILFAAEEERFTGEKHTKQFPSNAIKYIIEKFALTNSNNSVVVAYFMNPWTAFLAGPKMFFHYRNNQALYYGNKRAVKRWRDWRYINKWARKYGWKACWVNHQVSHAASAFYLSPFEKATIVTLDGRGEYLSVGFFRGINNNISYVGGISIPFSVGYYYSYITRYLGFKPQHDEYKIMGLAAYGKPLLTDRLSRLFSYNADKGCFVNTNSLDFWDINNISVSRDFIDEFGMKRAKDDKLLERHMNMAASVQKHTEQIVCDIVAEGIKKTGISNVCLAGGVALNCVANSQIAKLNQVSNLFIPPAANDAGTSLGAALIIASKKHADFHGKVSWTPYLGPSYANNDIILVLGQFAENMNYIKIQSPALTGAKLLSKGKIIGWFQEKMEWGPRALGNRSILAPAFPISIKDRLNRVIKYREAFRPFAPMILEEELSQYFIYPKSSLILLEYMLGIGVAKHHVRDIIPAAINVDGSARVQIINRGNNPKIYELINNYKRMTGVPVIINTSFNVRGRPIVMTPYDAVRDFLDSDLDNCIIGEFLLSKLCKNG